MSIFARLGLLLLGVTLVVSAGCGEGRRSSAGGEPTTEPPTPADAAAIRDLDLARVSAVATLAAQLGGGEPDVRAAVYADLTGDGREEAVVPIASGGTLGNLGYVVLTLKAGQPAVILTATRDRSSPGGVSLKVEDGRLYKYVGKYGPEDPLCCPSVLIRTSYRWDGSHLQVEREEELTQTTPKR